MGLKSEGSSRCSPVVVEEVVVETFVDKEEEGTIGEGGGGGSG